MCLRFEESAVKMGIQDCIEFLIERGYQVRGLSNEDILSMVEELQHEGDPDDREVEWADFD